MTESHLDPASWKGTYEQGGSDARSKPRLGGLRRGLVITSPREADRSVAHLPAEKGRVLVVEDQAALCRVYALVLEHAGYSVVQAPDAEHAIDALTTGRYDVVLTDINMPGMNGIELLRRIRERSLDIPVLLMTGNPTVA